MWGFDCRIVQQTFMRTCVAIEARCTFTAAADTPAHGETGVRKPLANTEAHTHVVSLVIARVIQ